MSLCTVPRCIAGGDCTVFIDTEPRCLLVGIVYVYITDAWPGKSDAQCGMNLVTRYGPVAWPSVCELWTKQLCTKWNGYGAMYLKEPVRPVRM